MYKIFLSFVIVASLNAEVVDGVAIVVKGSAITLLDIKKEMQSSKIDAKRAADMLIRKKLEELEIKEKQISVSSSEVYEDIKKIAAANNMDVSSFYEAIRNSNGMTSSELKEKVKEKLLSQKLYSSIAYSSVSQPSESEIKEYYELHKDEFSHPSGFTAILYQAKDMSRLQEKVDNPMFYSPDIQTMEQELPYNKIAPELAALLSKTPLDTFTQIIPDGQGGFISFYLKKIHESTKSDLESVRNNIVNAIMAGQREQVLSDHFARLKHNAEIKTLRMPK